MRRVDVEHFRVVHVDGSGGLLGVTEVCSDHASRVEVPIRRIIADALALGSAALILSHNHPGGDPHPSRADVHVTRRLSDVAGALGIRIHDHVVTADGRNFSFRAAGLL